MSNTVWTSTISSEMVVGWTDEQIEELRDALDKAVEQIFTEIEGE